MLPQVSCVARIFEEFTLYIHGFRKQFSEIILYYDNLKGLPCEEML